MSSPMYICLWDDPTAGPCTAAALDHSDFCALHLPLVNSSEVESSKSSTLGSENAANPSRGKVLCGATTMAGDPCRMPARGGSTLCVNHDPAYADQQRANVRNGGIASGQARKPIPLSEVHLDFVDREGIQAAVEALVKLEFVGRISPSRSRNILKGLTIAYRNFNEPTYRPSSHRSLHDDYRLHEARRDLLKNIACIAEEQALRDAETESAHLQRQAAFRPEHRSSVNPASREPRTASQAPRTANVDQQLDKLLAGLERLL